MYIKFVYHGEVKRVHNIKSTTVKHNKMKLHTYSNTTLAAYLSITGSRSPGRTASQTHFIVHGFGEAVTN